MQLTVCDGDRITAVELTDDCSLENMVVLVMMDLERESHDATAVNLLKDGVDVLGTDRTRTLAQAGLVDGDLLLYFYAPAVLASLAAPAAQSIAPGAAAASTAESAPSSSNAISWDAKNDGLDASRKRMAELLGQTMNVIKKQKLLPEMMTEEQKEEAQCRELYEKMKNPRTKIQILNLRREMHDQYVKNPSDYEGFKREYLLLIAEQKRKRDAMYDPQSEEGQKLVLEEIRMQNCDRLYEEALEKMPEAFFQVHMLYVKINVNGVSTYAFIDSGAQVSLMALSFAKKAGLEHLMDTRFRSRLAGIGGSDKTAGTIYSCEFELGNAKFDARVTVTNDKFDVLIGLDFMRRHGCCIDLARNRLSFTETTYAEFLSDAEVNEFQKERNDHVHHSFKVDEDKVAELIGLGFTKEEAEKALTDCVNDAPDAIRYLHAKAEREAEEVAEAVAAANIAAGAEAAKTGNVESEKKMEQ